MEQLTAFYIAIKQRLNSISKFKTIDIYTGQLEQEEQGTGDTLVLPAAYIRWEPIQWQHIGQRIQRADLVFEVIVGDYKTGRSRQGNSNEQVEDALRSLQLVKDVKKALVGFSDDEINMSSIGAGQETLMQTAEKYVAHVIQFRCKIEDDTTRIVLTPAENAVTLVTEINLKTPGIS